MVSDVCISNSHIANITVSGENVLHQSIGLRLAALIVKDIIYVKKYLPPYDCLSKIAYTCMSRLLQPDMIDPGVISDLVLSLCLDAFSLLLKSSSSTNHTVE